MDRGLLLGAVASLILMVAAPMIKDIFPSQPYLPGILCGSLFSLYWLYSKQKEQTSLHKTEWRKFKLNEKRQISHNTAIYRFQLLSLLGLPIGQHLSIGALINGKEMARSYTPISSDDDKGFFELLIKTYPTGNISKHIEEIKIGESIRVKGPKGNFGYQPNLCKEIGMIAGGTGITPMLQIITAIVKNPADKTKVSLIFANVNEEDIICRSELDKLSKDDRISIFYVLNNPPQDFKGGKGFVSKAMIEEHIQSYTSDRKVLLCGPPPMLKAMMGYLEELGWPKPQAVSKLSDAIFKF